MLAALEEGVKGDKWFSLIDKVYRPETLQRAWGKVKENRGSAGVDRQSVEQFEDELESNLEWIEQQLRTQTYQPKPTNPNRSNGSGYRSQGIRNDVHWGSPV